tara:strand:+ start:2804 stop:2995 length:192 start_codon:yes stop_codon:yes gene_type:complete
MRKNKMTTEVIKHKIILEDSVKIILAVIAIGILILAVKPPESKVKLTGTLDTYEQNFSFINNP